MEYQSCGTSGPHPGGDMFMELSPRTKPYCGVKCSQGLHIPATTILERKTGPNKGMLPIVPYSTITLIFLL